MRFEIGQIIPFARVSFHPRVDADQMDARLCRLFHPGQHVLDGIDVKLLEVTEHHVVPSTWDDNPQHDGFVLREVGTEQIWHNQYPRASYGQLDDSCDRIAARKNDHFTEDEVDAMEPQQLDFWIEKWTTALSMLEAIYRALHGREHERLELEDDVRVQFEAYHDQFKAAVEKAVGKRVEYRELEIGNPKRRIPECWKAVFVEEPISQNAA